jgi:hypothetical protein
MQINDINIGQAERGLFVGTTRTGKSTLGAVLLDNWVQRDTNSLTLLVDPKPRFKAQYDQTGLPAAWRYRSWRKGTTIPHSYRLQPGANGTDLARLFEIARANTPKNRGAVIIAQPSGHHIASWYPWLNYCIHEFYGLANKKRWLYLYVDELLAFLRASRSLHTGVIQVITAGGERGIGFLGGTQRPRWIAVEAMTELTKLYLFRIDTWLDLKHLREMGLPPTFRAPDEDHIFNYFDKHTRHVLTTKLSEPLAARWDDEPAAKH